MQITSIVKGFEESGTLNDTITNGFKLLMELQRCTKSDIVCIQGINLCCNSYLSAVYNSNGGLKDVERYPSLEECWFHLKKLIDKYKEKGEEIPEEIETCIENFDMEYYQLEPYSGVLETRDDLILWNHFPKSETWKETIDNAFHMMQKFHMLLGNRIDVMGDGACEVKMAYAIASDFGGIDKPILESYWKYLKELIYKNIEYEGYFSEELMNTINENTK